MLVRADPLSVNLLASNSCHLGYLLHSVPPKRFKNDKLSLKYIFLFDNLCITSRIAPLFRPKCPSWCRRLWWCRRWWFFNNLWISSDSFSNNVSEKWDYNLFWIEFSQSDILKLRELTTTLLQVDKIEIGK